MISDKFVLLGLLLQIYGCTRYTLDTLRGKTKPNRVSWLIWSVAPIIAFAAELDKEAGLRSVMTLSVGLSPAIVLAASFVNRKAYWKLSWLDYVCGLLAVLGLVLWAIFRDGNVAIAFSVLADFLAAVPTLIKSFNFPETETVAAYSVAIVNAGIALLTIDHWNLANSAFPIYIFLVNIVFVLFIQFKLGLRLARRDN
jgi:hypothetical protein